MGIEIKTYKNKPIYVLDNRFYCTGKRGNSLEDCTTSLSEAKADIDKKSRNEIFNQEMATKKLKDLENEKLMDQRISKNKVQENISIVTALLNKVMKQNKNTTTQIYYKDGYQKSIQIKHISGKKFVVKFSRRKSTTIYYQELFKRLVNIRNKYPSGRWV